MDSLESVIHMKSFSILHALKKSNVKIFFTEMVDSVISNHFRKTAVPNDYVLSYAEEVFSLGLFLFELFMRVIDIYYVSIKSSKIK